MIDGRAELVKTRDTMPWRGSRSPTDRTLINLEQLNEIFINAVATKITKHKPIKFFTQELKNAVRIQNKARKAIWRARSLRHDTIEPYRLYQKARKYFRTVFKKAKKDYNIKQIKKACQDPTGAEFYRIIKCLEPQLNKKRKSIKLTSTMK